jgi:hypothetical protein
MTGLTQSQRDQRVRPETVKHSRKEALGCRTC